MPRFIKQANGKTHEVETSVPREIHQLRAEGFKEQKATAAEASTAEATPAAPDMPATATAAEEPVQTPVKPGAKAAAQAPKPGTAPAAGE